MKGKQWQVPMQHYLYLSCNFELNAALFIGRCGTLKTESCLKITYRTARTSQETSVNAGRISEQETRKIDSDKLMFL
eukprot:scaffold190256_cov32-Prasinocladus_malaysianus.AAC.1